MKPVLAVDFDDVLFPFMNRMVPHYNETYGTNFHIEDYKTFEFYDLWGGSREDAWDRVAAFFDCSHSGVDPLPGALEGIEALSEHYELAVVTARDESLRTYTEEWLHEMFPGRFHHVHLCNSYSLNPDIPRRTKLSVIEQLDAVALIDDSPNNVAAVARTGRRGLLFGDYPWNRTNELPEGVKRFVEWQSIVESLVIAA